MPLPKTIDRMFHTIKIELQIANGLNLGTCLQSCYAGTAMIDGITEEMQKRLRQARTSNCQKISIILDESSTVSRKSCLVVYLRTACPDDSSSKCFVSR